MNASTAYHQLGKFIVVFQHLEESVNGLLELMAGTDDNIVRIIANDLEYNKRLHTVDVLFAYFVDLRKIGQNDIKSEFHTLIVELRRLGERRNELVHSRYNDWRDIHGNDGLLRTNSKLRSSKGKREETEEELQPEAFNADLRALSLAAVSLEKFRMELIDWLYPV